MKSLNLNSIIKVKLTPKGTDIYYHQYDEFNKQHKLTGVSYLSPLMPKIDKDGYTEFSLWKFINLYGKYFQMGMREYPIQDLRIYIEDQDLDEVLKEVNV